MPTLSRPRLDPSAALDMLDRLYDERAGSVYGRAFASVGDTASASAVVETAFRQVARALPHLAATADLAAVLDLTVQHAIAAASAAPATRPARSVRSGLAAWRMADVALAHAADGTREAAESD